jgi:hypothetical protein
MRPDSISGIKKMKRFFIWIEDHSGLASWVQAIGAIIALALSVYLAYDASTQSERQASEAAKSWSAQFQDSLEEYIAECTRQDKREGKIKRQGVQIQALYAISQTIAPDRLPPDKIRDYIKLRMLAMEFMEIAQSFDQSSKDQSMNWGLYCKAFDSLNKKAALTFLTLRN